MCRNKEAISPKRPWNYVEHEQSEVRRNSSIDPRVLRRGSRLQSVAIAAAVQEQEREEREEEEKGGVNYKEKVDL